MTGPRHPLAAVALVAALSAGCDSAAPADDADTDAIGDADADGDGDRDADRDDGQAFAPGPVVLVANAFLVLEDRLCDLDGDGLADNAIADLGAPVSTVAAMGMNASLAGSLDDGYFRLLLHVPWVDEPPGHMNGAITVIMYRGLDSDIPPESSDDYSGDEPYYVLAQFLDPCGEPAYVWSETAVLDGRVTSRGVPVTGEYEGVQIALRGDFDGQFAPDGRSMEATLCAYAPIEDLGLETSEGMNALELLLSGGGFIAAGLNPNVDVDQDGLERFTLDGDDHIEQCIDGDGTLIPGRDCWQDARMADGFAFTFGMTMTTARFAGREPGWELQVAGRCDGGMPDESLFGDFAHEGECAGLDEECDPLAAEPCCDADLVCRGRANTVYQCFPRCTPTPCEYGGAPGMCEPSRGGPTVATAYCQPLGNDVPAAACEPGSEGCATEYGADAATGCVQQYSSHRPVCLERCEPGESGCDGAHPYCRPLLTEEGGFCAAE